MTTDAGQGGSSEWPQKALSYSGQLATYREDVLIATQSD